MDNKVSFAKWDKLFRSQQLSQFNGNAQGLCWLKVKAISRGRLMDKFLNENKISLKATKTGERFIELYDYLVQKDGAEEMLNSFLRNSENELYNTIGVNERQLKSDLYKITSYKWGGDQNNSLDRFFVSHYVKAISKYDELTSKRNEICVNSWNYVENSWYNNWTSFLTESIFKKHSKVISACGEIKSVDFFISQYPIDLKVTYFPKKFMDGKLKAYYNGKMEFTWLKKKAKENGIVFDRNATEAQQIYEITQKFSELGHDDVLKEIKKNRMSVVNEAMNNPSELMKWLYEKQGTMRFGAENRLFLILVDSDDMDNSWKLKRSFQLIEPKVNSYLDNLNDNTLQEIHFVYNKQKFTAKADTIFVIK